GYIIWWPAHVTQRSSGIEARVEAVPGWMVRALTPPPPPSSPPLSHYDNASSFAGILRAVALASPGEKSGMLFWGACRMGEAVHEGKISLRLATDLLREAAMRAGWQVDPRKMESTLRNGLRRGGAAA